MAASASSSVAPRAIASPRRRLRECGLEQVTTQSPSPASLAKVITRAPALTPRRASSAMPRVRIAALPLSPAPMPSQTPAAIATTFFNAPPYSTPTRSVVLYTRNIARVHASRTCSAASCAPATTVAAGRPRATSMAMFGPLSAVILASRSAPSTSHSTELIVRPVRSSKPFAALTTTASDAMYAAAAPAISRMPCVGIASSTMPAPFTALGRSLVTRTSSLSAISVRYVGLCRVSVIAAATSGRRAHSVTSLSPPLLRVCSRAVPHEPAPTTAIRPSVSRGRVSSPRHHAQTHTGEAVDSTDAVLEIAPVGEVEQLRVVHKEHDRRREASRLGRVEDLEPPSLVRAGRVLIDRRPDQRIERTRSDVRGARVGDLRGCLQHPVDVASFGGTERQNRRTRHEVECGRDRLEERRVGTNLLRHQVPLVRHDYESGAGVDGVAGNMAILGHDPMRRVHHHDPDVAALEGAQRTQQAVAFDVRLDHATTPDPGGVHESDRPVPERRDGVDGVTGSSCHR